MRKKTKNFIIALILLVISFFAVKHMVLVSVAKNLVKHFLALEIHMNSVSLNPVNGSIIVKGLKIYNPRGFKDRVLGYVPLVVLDFKPKTLLEKGTFFDSIVIHVKELNIIRNEDDVVNLSRVKALTPQEKAKEIPPFLVDSYVVEVGKVRYIDYTKEEEEEREKEIALDIKEEYKNLKDTDNIAKIIAYKIFFNGKIGNIGVDIQKIQSDLAKLAEQNKKLADEIAKISEEKIDKAKEVVKEKIEKTKEVIKEKVEDIKEAIEEKIDKEESK